MSATRIGPAGGETIGALLDWAVERLGSCVSSPWLDAGLLLAHASGFERSVVLAFRERRIDAACAEAFRDSIVRRAAGEPLAYLTGSRDFHALTLRVSPAVLVPRPETEMLVDAALERLASPPGAVVLDLGTGSGAIALAIKQACPDVSVTGIDCEEAALAVARENADRLGLDVRLIRSDWFSALGAERFDLIVANPPYVPSGDPHFAGPLRFEPRTALDGGADGLAAFTAILDGAHDHLGAAGVVLLEHGFDQREALTTLAASCGYETVLARDDLAGLPRVLGLRKGAR